MKRILEFNISGHKTKKNKEGFTERALPPNLQLWVWWDNKKPRKYNVPESGKLRVYHQYPYKKQIRFDIAYRCSAVSKSDRIGIAIESQYGTTSNISTEQLTMTDVGGYNLCIENVVAKHYFFRRPVIPDNVPYSEVVGLVVNTTAEVETLSRMMTNYNAENLEKPFFDIVSITHMGCAYANQRSYFKEQYYTLFYRMSRRILES